MFILQEKPIDPLLARNTISNSLNGALVTFEGIVRDDKKLDLTVCSLLYIADTPDATEIEEWPPTKPCRQVPFSQFPFNKDDLDKNKSYLIFCAKGGRSHFMAEVLVNEGYRALSVNNGIASVNAYLKKLES